MERNSCSGKERMNKNGYGGDPEDYLVGFSWPPRSYTCSFCKREFRSAQALGGHMNVHRRDRARLRQYSSPNNNNFKDHISGNYSFLNLNLSPSPSPNRNFSSSSSSFGISHPFPSSLPSLVSPLSEMRKNTWGLRNYPSSPKASYLSNMNKGKSYFELLDPFTDETEDGHELSDSKEGLDLELRLGYS